MFDDHQSDQAHNTDNGGSDASSAPASGIGLNPTPTYVPPADTPSAPAVVLPTRSTAGGSADDDHSEDSVTTPASTPGSTGLEEIKRHALAQLSPLVNQLEQTPEEKYKTIMMMIQASDNQDLINDAYENAQKITDEKAKAQALLNIVNEINYFTQKSQNQG